MTKKRLAFLIINLPKRYFSNNISISASALAYNLLFSFLPLAAFFSAVISFVHLSPNTIGILQDILPTEVEDLVISYLEYANAEPSFSLGIFGAVFTVYFFSNAVSTLIKTIYRLYNVKKPPKGWQSRALAVLFTILLMISLSLTFFLIVLGENIMNFVLNFISLPSIAGSIWDIVRYVLGSALVFVFILSLYTLVPNRKYRLKTAIPGTIFTFVSWIVFSLTFSFYVSNLARYSLIYGSLGVLITLMLWLYLTATVLILGAQLNVIWEESKNMK